MQGKYRQAVAAKAGEWSTASSTLSGEEEKKLGVWKQRISSSERGLMPWKRREECKEGRVSLLEKEEIRKMCEESSREVEDETESRRKLYEQMKKLEMELRDVDRWSLVSKEMQDRIKESLQHQLQDVEKKRPDLVPEHQKAQKKSQKIQSIQDKRKMQRGHAAAEEEMRKRRDDVKK